MEADYKANKTRDKLPAHSQMISLFNDDAKVIYHERHININTTSYNRTLNQEESESESHENESCLVISIHSPFTDLQFILIYCNT